MARYLFCVVSVDATPDLRGWEGEGAPLSLVAAGDVAGVVGTVDESRFGDETLARAARDLNTLAPYAKAHQDVVQYVFERAPAVVPLTFGSLHATDEDVRRSLTEQNERLLRLLRRFAGTQEWGLRLARRRVRVAVTAGDPGAGTAYLASRRAELHGELVADAQLAADDLDRALGAASAGRRVLAEASGDLVLRAAYLVRSADADTVKRIVLERGQDLERLGLAAELSGPWPPYSFVDGAGGQESQ
ncbi:MAG: hypothetical protein AUH85_12460 [Chloroflexi bacterium 13_1_40CM_4_68_4]|nr:MAG: hypothetical protein AUH85_12460 [Chloroflexi bacterium 13_1_40CM_4_68_4]